MDVDPRFLSCAVALGVISADNPFDRWHPEEGSYTPPHGARLGVIIPFRRWLRFGLSLGVPMGRLV